MKKISKKSDYSLFGRANRRAAQEFLSHEKTEILGRHSVSPSRKERKAVAPKAGWGLRRLYCLSSFGSILPMRWTMMKIAAHASLAGLLFSAAAACAAPTITITPTVITNNYVGSIQLTISNLSSPGAQVRVDRFLDANSNGVISAYYWPGQSFFVTDGQEPTVGGVRNSNMPGDDDSQTNGVIVTHVPYPTPDLTLSHISGQYIYQVKDLGNNETATALMQVQQQVLSQGVQGKVFTSVGNPLGAATVVLSQQNGNDGFGAVTDTNGNFLIYAPPGQYNLLMVFTGEIANGAQFTVNSNAFTTINLTNTPSDGTIISGTVTDSVSGMGLPGILISGQTQNGQFVYKATRMDGTYTLEVNSNNWNVQLNTPGAILGYDRTPNNSLSINASSGSVSNVDFQLIKGNALIWGTVFTAPDYAPAVSVLMDASDASNSVFSGVGITDQYGNYSVAIVAGHDSIAPDGSSLSGFQGTGNAFFTTTNDQAFEINWLLQPITSSISGIAKDNLGNVLSNITVIADPTGDTSGSENISIQTASDGAFSFAVGPGAWNIFLECHAALNNDLISPQLTEILTNNQNLGGVILIAQRETTTIFGKVTDSGTPLVGVNMFANASSSGINYVSGCVNTDSNGNYSIPVFPGVWSVGGNYPGMSNETGVVTGATGVELNFVLGSPPSAPTLSSPILSGGQLHFQVSGNNDQEYFVETSTNLASGWQAISTNYGSFSFTNAIGIKRAQFYRVVTGP